MNIITKICRRCLTTNSLSYGDYSHALTCSTVTDTLPKLAQRLPSQENKVVDLEKARKEHEGYKRVLESVGIKLIELPANKEFPDGIFVEDTAIACHNTIMITRPGHQTRRNEVKKVEKILKEATKNLKTKFDIIPIPESVGATIDGGDVCFTGKEFLVGQSSRTNKAAADFMRTIFKPFPVTTIQVHGTLHLKTVMSSGGPNTVFWGGSEISNEMLKEAKSKSKYLKDFDIVQVPDDLAANVLYVNGHLIHAPATSYPESINVIEDYGRDQLARNYYKKIHSSQNSQFEIVDGSLTCRSFTHVRQPEFVDLEED
ncbi:hypothetical protein SNEBB_005547 [Seison nebaliae]|nr:hypothetical protein SNEBB_005547 [Seison nebaliae]